MVQETCLYILGRIYYICYRGTDASKVNLLKKALAIQFYIHVQSSLQPFWITERLLLYYFAAKILDSERCETNIISRDLK